MLKQLDSDWIDRRAVEELLGVSKTVAWRILRACGGEDGPGSTLVCRRERLIHAFTRMLSTGEVEREVRRRDRVSAYLDRLGELGRAKRTQIATHRKAEELLNSRFAALPAGVEFTPRRLVLAFSSPEEFLEKMGAVIFALQNDFESIRTFIESATH